MLQLLKNLISVKNLTVLFGYKLIILYLWTKICKDVLNNNLNNKNIMKITKFQAGGPVAPAAPAQEPAPAQDPIMEIAQMFMQGLESQDCGLLAQGAQMFLQLIQQTSAPAPVGQAPEAPMFRRGGKMIR